MLVQALEMDGPMAAFNGGIIVQPDMTIVDERLSHYYGIPREQIATLGDGANDVLMFERSGLSIATGNASEDEGFAKAIKEFILPRAVAAPALPPAG